MTADKMFEELGYKLINHDRTCIEYENKDIEQGIDFYLKNKLISKFELVDGETLLIGDITIPELKAINEKCEELGWLDEQ